MRCCRCKRPNASPTHPDGDAFCSTACRDAYVYEICHEFGTMPTGTALTQYSNQVLPFVGRDPSTPFLVDY